MIRNPTFHYDFLLSSPGAPEFQAIVERQFRSFTDAELIGGTIPRFLNELDGTTRMSSYMTQLYKRFGQNTFVVGPKVQELFRRTKLAKVTPEMIVPPASAFYIGVADCPWQLWGGERTKLHNLTGIYVSFSKVFQGPQPPGGYKYGDELPPGVEVHDCINIMLWGEANERSLDKFDDTVLWFSISLDRWIKGGMDLETFFENHSVMTAEADDLKDWNPTANELDPFAPAYVPEDESALAIQREMLVNVLRLVLNVCLYMGSEDPDLIVKDGKDKALELQKKISTKKSPGKRKKLERQLANLSRTRLVYVGPMFEELPAPDRRAATAREYEGGTHASPIEHGVSPHWQRYHVGSGDNRSVKWRLKGMYVRGSGKPDRTITKIRE
jgi:hypothetical protein